MLTETYDSLQLENSKPKETAMEYLNGQVYWRFSDGRVGFGPIIPFDQAREFSAAGNRPGADTALWMSDGVERPEFPKLHWAEHVPPLYMMDRPGGPIAVTYSTDPADEGAYICAGGKARRVWCEGLRHATQGEAAAAGKRAAFYRRLSENRTVHEIGQ